MHPPLLASIVLLSALLPAQNCGTLASTGTGAPGTSFEVALTGSTADSFAIAVIGPNTGSTAITVGPIAFTLGLDQPFFPVPLGRTDGNGDASLTVHIPNGLQRQLALNAQAVTLTLSRQPFAIAACVSNVIAFTIG